MVSIGFLKLLMPCYQVRQLATVGGGPTKLPLRYGGDPLIYKMGRPVSSLLGEGEEELVTLLFATKLACQYHHNWVKGKKS